MIISHEHRIIFLHSRKTAGTSIKVALSQVLGPDDVFTELGEEDLRIIDAYGGVHPQNWQIPWPRWRPRDYARKFIRRKPPRFTIHMTARTVRQLVGQSIWDSYFTFAVDRNPWDLAVSAYTWHRHYEHYTRPFTEFVAEELDFYRNWPIYTIRGSVAVDRLVRYDQLEDEWRHITDLKGLPDLVLPRAKSGVRQGHYRDWHTPETRERVADMFSNEISLFGWTY